MKALLYGSPQHFFADLAVAQAMTGVALTEPQIQECYALYLHAKKTTLKVLGLEKFTLSQDTLKNFGVVSGTNNQLVKKIIRGRRKGWFNFRSNRTMPKELVSGSVLKTDYWTVLANDAFILGTCHAAFLAGLADVEDIHVTLPDEFLINPMPFIWNEKRNAPRVTAREFIGLVEFGYRPVITQTSKGLYFMQFTLENQESLNKAGNASLINYAELMNRCSNRVLVEHKIRRMFIRPRMAWVA